LQNRLLAKKVANAGKLSTFRHCLYKVRKKTISSSYDDSFLVSFYVCVSRFYDAFFSFRKA
jgi:hypothetical protein